MASAASYLSRAPNNSLADASNEVRHLRVRTPRRKFVLASAAVGVAGALAWPLTARFLIRTIPSLVQIEIPLSAITRSLGWNHNRAVQCFSL